MNKNKITCLQVSIIHRFLPAFIGLFLLAGSLHGQISIGSENNQTVTPQSFSVLELLSNTGGLRLPLLTTAERDALEATASFQAEKTGKGIGLMIYNTTTNCVNTWNGSLWIALCAPVRVTGITLNKSSLQLFVPNGYTWATTADQLTAAIVPSNATVKDITWFTSNPLVATVSQAGIVTAVGNGRAVIKATATDGGYTATCNITVGCGAATVDGGWLIFMCHNLGADPRINPFTYVKGDAVGENGTLGYLYEWGRRSDGHEKRNSLTTATLATDNEATAPAAVVGKFIIAQNSPYDWRNGGGETSRWGDGTANANPAKGANDPCPSGWKVPSQAQWASIFRGGTTVGGPETATANTWTWTGKSYFVGRSLYLPAAGYRYFSNGDLYDNNYGFYWSSTINTSIYSYFLRISNTEITPVVNGYHTFGASVRCVSE